MSEIITTGKTVDEAIDEGCRLLGVSREEASIEILEMPARKLFRTIPARVRITRNEEDFSVKDLLSGFGSEEKKEEKNSQPRNDAKKKENQKKQPRPAKQEKAEEEKKPAWQEKPVKPEKAEKAEEPAKAEGPAAEAPAEEKKPSSKKKKNKKKKNGREQKNTEEKKGTEEEGAEDAPDTSAEILGYLTEEELPERAARALEYLRQIVAALGFEKVEYAFGKTEKGVRFILTGEDAPNLIGRRGETMDALQYLCTVGSSRDGGDYCRISLDIEGYRSRREEALAELAAKTAARVKKNGYNQTLEPMNPYERRIVHAAIQEIEGVTSHSVGSEPYRKVVVTLEGGGGDRRNRGRKNGKRNGSSKPRPRPENNEFNATAEDIQAEAERAASVQVKKELKSQEEFVGALYGKIEL